MKRGHPHILTLRDAAMLIQRGGRHPEGVARISDRVGSTVIDGGDAVSPPTLPTTFTGTVVLSRDRPVRDFGQVSVEILNHLLAKPGTDVTIRLNIEATKPNGFDDNTVRTITENARTLKFEEHGFGSIS